MEEITSLAFIYIKCPQSIGKGLQVFQKLAFLHLMYRHFYESTFRLLQNQSWVPSWKINNTLTGPANCKKTTRHYAHLPLCGKSRKTNNAKSRKLPRTSIWATFWRFQDQKSQSYKFFWKIGFFKKLKVIFSTDFTLKTKMLEPFFRKIRNCLILV